MKFLKFKQNQKNGHRGRYLFMVALILTFFGMQTLTISAIGEEKKEEPSPSAPGIITLNYSNGKIVQDFLPYYKSFQIVGSTKLPDIDADWVRLEIWKLGKEEMDMLNKIKKAKKKQDKAKFDRLNEEFKKHFEKGDKIPVETTEWKRGIGDTTSTFKLTVSPLTGWKKRYHFTFTFYDKPDRDSKFITKIVDSIIKKLQTDLEDSGQITYTKVNDLLNGVIKKETEEMKLNKGYQFLSWFSVNWKFPIPVLATWLPSVFLVSKTPRQRREFFKALGQQRIFMSSHSIMALSVGSFFNSL